MTFSDLLRLGTVQVATLQYTPGEGLWMHAMVAICHPGTYLAGKFARAYFSKLLMWRYLLHHTDNGAALRK